MLSSLSHKALVEDKVRKSALMFGHIASKASYFVLMQILSSIGSIGGRLALNKKGSLMHSGAFIVKVG